MLRNWKVDERPERRTINTDTQLDKAETAVGHGDDHGGPDGGEDAAGRGQDSAGVSRRCLRSLLQIRGASGLPHGARKERRHGNG